MYREYLTLEDVCSEFEDALKINYKSRMVEAIITDTKADLKATFHVEMDKPLHELLAESSFLENDLNTLSVSIESALKDLSFLLALSLYDSRYPETVEDKDYLGFAKDVFLGSLKKIQRADLYKESDVIIPALKRATDKIDMCLIKRLLIIMFVLYELGVDEGVCIIAQYLYIGGL